MAAAATRGSRVFAGGGGRGGGACRGCERRDARPPAGSPSLTRGSLDSSVRPERLTGLLLSLFLRSPPFWSRIAAGVLVLVVVLVIVIIVVAVVVVVATASSSSPAHRHRQHHLEAGVVFTDPDVTSREKRCEIRNPCQEGLCFSLSLSVSLPHPSLPPPSLFFSFSLFPSPREQLAASAAARRCG